MFSPSPWIDTDPETRFHQVLVELHLAGRKLDDLAAKLPTLRKDIVRFRADLEAILKLYREDISAWRASRAFAAVHLPSLVEALEALVSLEEDPLDDGKLKSRKAAAEEGLRQALAIGKEVRARISASRLDRLEVDLETLDDRGDRPDGPAPEARPLIARTSRQISASLSGATRKLTREGRRLGRNLGTRAGGGLSYVSQVAGAGIDLAEETISCTLSAPVRALRGTLSETLGGMAVGGLFTALIFPPAVPLVAGLVLLSAPESFGDALASETEREREKYKSSRDARRKALEEARAQMIGLPTIVRMETPCLYFEINRDTGQADGLVLCGRYTGYALHDLDNETLGLMHRHAPDPETRQALEAWMARDAHRQE